MSRFRRRAPRAASRGRRRGLIPLLLGGLWRLAGFAWRQKGQAAAAAALAAVLWSLWTFAQRADVFQIAEVQVVPAEALAAPEGFVGRSLWAVNLRATAQELQQRHPHLKAVRVIRRLPNVLRIEAIERVPIAQVSVESQGPQGRQVRWHPIDPEGIVLPAAAGSTRDLPRVLGVRGGAPMALALSVLDAVRAAQPGLPRRIATIDVGDPHQIRLITEDDVEVRCGAPEELPEQLGQLRAVLRALDRRQTAARYIDLRFGEPVVAPRT